MTIYIDDSHQFHWVQIPRNRASGKRHCRVMAPKREDLQAFLTLLGMGAEAPSVCPGASIYAVGFRWLPQDKRSEAIRLGALPVTRTSMDALAKAWDVAAQEDAT